MIYHFHSTAKGNLEIVDIYSNWAISIQNHFVNTSANSKAIGSKNVLLEKVLVSVG